MEDDIRANYFAIIPAYIRYNKELKFGERLMYGEITALSNKEGYCYAKNKYFAELYNVSQSTISRWISHLAELNSIDVQIIRNDKKETVTLTQDQITSITFQNEKIKGRIEITKVSADDNKLTK